MKVTVEDDRQFPDYKCVHIVALVSAVVNELGLDWPSSETVGERVQEAIEDADYMTDGIRTWAKSSDVSRKETG